MRLGRRLDSGVAENPPTHESAPQPSPQPEAADAVVEPGRPAEPAELGPGR